MRTFILFSKIREHELIKVRARIQWIGSRRCVLKERGDRITKLGRLEKKVMVGKKHAERGIKHVKRLLPHIKIKENQKYLEIGCGNGHVSKYLALKYNLNVTGTDVDPDMIRLANQDVGELKNIRFMEMDATSIPFEESEFDIVLSSGVLHHIRNWQDVLSEIGRVLKPGGYYIFGDIAYSRFTANLMRRITRKYGVYTIDDIVQSLKKQNMIVIHEEPRMGTIFRYYGKIFQKK